MYAATPTSHSFAISNVVVNTITATESVFNEVGVDRDFRVESDTTANALFVQGSDGFVGIGTSSPDTPLEIQIGSSGNALKLSSSTDGIPVYLAFEQQESGTKHVRGRVRAASNGADGGLIIETGSSGSMSERRQRGYWY
jgi:hypothetical protein